MIEEEFPLMEEGEGTNDTGWDSSVLVPETGLNDNGNQR